jgi:hypothetical protein
VGVLKLEIAGNDTPPNRSRIKTQLQTMIGKPLEITSFKSIMKSIIMSGLNVDIEHQGKIFHVQTQDKGLSSNYVETIIYKAGRVISSRRTYYTSYLNNPELYENIENIIQKQHESILHEIKGGKFDHL